MHSTFCENGDNEYVFNININNYEHVVLINAENKMESKLTCERKQSQNYSDLTLCPDVNSAFKLPRANSTAFIFASGNNVTHVLKSDTDSTVFNNMNQIAFCSSNSMETVSIVCEDGAGIAFSNVDDISIAQLNFSYCGVLRNSTSRNFSSHGEFRFYEFRVSLFFYNCSNLQLNHTVVQHSVNALGVGLYNTDGNVEVLYSNFINNTIANDTTFPGGGGFIIDYSYCIPGRIPCGNGTNVQHGHNSNSTYTFINCKFENNVARTIGTFRLLPFNETHEGLGRGGGIGIFLRGNARNNHISFFGCEFIHNKAHFGGGLFVSFGDVAISNVVNLNAVKFINNECFYKLKFGTGGGGMKILSLLNFQSLFTNDSKKFPESFSSITGNHVRVNALFENNRAINGGGISFVCGNQLNSLSHQTTQLEILRSTFNGNFARLGSALYVDLSPLFSDGIASSVNVSYSSFYNNSINYHQHLNNYSIGMGTIYVRKIRIMFYGRADFYNNIGSSIALIGTHARFSDTDASFINNKANKGAGIALVGTSFIVMDDDTNMLFEGNKADTAGSAIYHEVVGKGVLELSIECFVRHIDPYKMPEDWQGTFTFRNNGNISIFSSTVYGCTISNTKASDYIANDLIFCVEHRWIFENSSCRDEISTQGDIYWLSNYSDILAFPGKEFTVPIKVLDDLKHDITDQTGYSVYLNVNSTNVAEIDPNFQLTSGNISIIGGENVDIKIQLQSTGSRSHFVQLPVHLQECPPGFYFDHPLNDSLKGKCLCHSQRNYRGNLNCSDDDFIAEIPWNYWMGLDPNSPDENKLVMGEIANLYAEQHGSDRNVIPLPKSILEIDDAICGRINRTGVLCGECKKGFAVAVNSYYYVCTKCDNSTNILKNSFLYLVSSYVPYTVLFVAVIVFRLKLTSSAVSGFLLYAQLTASIDLFDISIHVTERFNNQGVERAYKFLHGIFNLGSFASLWDPFCISRSFSTLDVLCLEYAIALLPLVVIFITYIITKCRQLKCCSPSLNCFGMKTKFARRQKNYSDKGKAILHAIGAFLLLSYTKISLVSMKLLASTTLFDDTGRNVEYNIIYLAGYYSLTSKKFILPYGLLAIIFVIVFVLVPTLFLLGFPQLVDWILDKPRFKMFRRYWPSITIHAILDTFQGYYKPKYWFFSGIYLLFRLSIIISYCATNSYLQQYFLQQVFIMIALSLVSIFKPYKREIFNVVDTLIFLNLGLINVISLYFYSTSLTLHGMDKNLPLSLYTVQHVLLWLPMLYMLCYCIYKISIRSGIYSCIKKFATKKVRIQKTLEFSTDAANPDGSESDDEDADVALFKRAKSENHYLPPAENRRSEVMSTLVSVVQENVVSDIDTGSSGFLTGSNTDS